ncbi:MAG: glycosyltransferase [Gillisia sp.]
MKISIVIPVYKSDESLEFIVKEFNSIQKEQEYDLEIIFVNDSPFFIKTCKKLSFLQEKYSSVKVLTLRKNQGQHVATLAGISKATGKFIITMDDDLQHPVCDVPKLIDKIKHSAEVEGIFAIPNYKDRKHNLWRNFGSYILKKTDQIFLKKPKGLILSSFRIMNSDLARATVNSYNAMPSVSSIMINCSSNIINMKVSHNKREYGKTHYTLPKLVNLALNGILYYSSLPLKILGVIGLTGFLGSMLFTFWVIGRKIFIGIDFPGYASTVTLISFFGGLNLFAFGIIGEYLIRIIKEQQKPALKDLIKPEDKHQ